MGAYLSEPVKETSSRDSECDQFIYGVSSMQGWRMDMEDAESVLPKIDEKTSFFGVFDGHGGREVALYLAKHLPDYVLQTSSYGEGKLSEALKEAFLQIDSDLLTDAALQELRELAGFHDDHEESAESRCAEAVELMKEAEMPLEDLLAKYGCPTVKKTEGESATEDAIEIIFEDDDDDDDDDEEEDDEDDDDEDDDDDDDDENSDKIEKKLDQEVDDEDEEDKEPNDIKLKAFGDPGSSSGSTAIVCLLRDGVVTVANVGDSRCVLCSDGKAVDLSVDHKPTCETEKTRIEAAGGLVNRLGRVNNGLNLSRAIGDHLYKRNEKLKPEDQMISALPDIQHRKLSSADKFLILACDGVWDVVSSQECVDFINEKLASDPNQKLSSITDQLLHHCLASTQKNNDVGLDNMTVIVVRFKEGALQNGQLQRAVAEKRAGRKGKRLAMSPSSPKKKDRSES